jgi:hypothetical protein
MLVRRFEIFRHLRLEIVIAVVAMHAARLLGMGVDVDRDHIFDVGQLQLGHFRLPGGLIFGFGKLIIPYNKFRKAAEQDRA